MSKSEKWLIVVLFFIWLVRLPFLNEIPIFGDEANHLMLADQLLSGSVTIKDFVYGGIFPGLIIALSSLRSVFTNHVNPLFIGRAFSFGCTVATAYWLFKIAQKLFNEKTALFSVVAYFLFPITLFHGQLVMLEPLMTLFLVLSLYFCLKLSADLRELVIAGIFLYLATATKLLAILSLPALLVLPFIIYPKQMVKSLLLMVAMFLVVFVVLYPLVFQSSSHFLTDYLLVGTETFLVNLKLNLWRNCLWIPTYYSWLIIFLLSGVFVIGLKEKSLKIFWLFGWTGTVILLESIVGGRFFYPRHLFPLSVPLALLTGIGFWKLWKLKTFPARIVVTITLVFLGFKAMPYYLNRPDAKLVAEDKHQFYEDWISGVGLKDLGDDLKFLIQNNKKARIYIGDEALLVWALPNVFGVNSSHLVTLSGYFGGPKSDLEKQVTRGVNSYLVLNREPYLPRDFKARMVRTYPKGPNRSIVLWQLEIR